MSKNGLALVSLIAAVPGGILTVVLVLNFLERANRLTGMLWAVSIVTILTSVLVTVLPAGVMLYSPKAEEAGRGEDEDVESTDDETGDVEETFKDDTGEPELDGFDDDVVAEEGDELTMGEDDLDDDVTATIDADGDTDLFMEDDQDFGLELDEDDEEEER